jgi:alkylhydroperoxidase family enzyme
MAASNASAVWNEKGPNRAETTHLLDVAPPVPVTAPHGTGPRLEPIDTPRGIRLRFAYWAMRHWMGKVMTPVKIVNARVPESLAITSSFQKFAAKGVTLDPGLQILVSDWVSRINGCTFCEDLGRAIAARRNLGLERKFDDLPNYRTSRLFSDKERAALAYVEATTRNKVVSDEVFADLRRHFTEREVVEITLVCAIENFYNLTNLPLGIGSDGFCALAPVATT